MAAAEVAMSQMVVVSTDPQLQVAIPRLSDATSRGRVRVVRRQDWQR
jgi:hypothetical protein